MRLLVVSDLHYSLNQFDWLCERCAEHDVLIIAGDLLDIAGHADLDTQIVVVEKYLVRLAQLSSVLVCSGNHDLDAETPTGDAFAEWLGHIEIPNVYVDTQSVCIGDVTFTMCPWWEGEETRARVQQQLEAESRKRGPGKWVWIYHAPPAGAKTSWNGKVYSGDSFLAEMIAALHPDIVFGGHIHNSPFYAQGSWFDRVGDTWVFNPGHEVAGVPSFISVDLDTLEATWES
ncbi:MAG TPA: metallophosphoesterase family protein, partial [Candidatus Hydrogenedentes bacterium]|nr:metallophosphoesterase family protein [Candidatus Hydrogenedentota bacterium]